MRVRHSVLLLVIFFTSLMTSFSFAADCVAIQGTMPDPGSCKGPIQRSQIKLSTAEPFNNNCPVGKVFFYQDGDTTKPTCGQCIPGKAGVDDELRLCEVNEFCNDDAVCDSVRNHPNYGKECPYENGFDSSVGWCGAGLRCINHVCLPCEDGTFDYSDGKMCVFNEWTYSPWNRIFYEPTPALIAICLVLLLSYGFISFFGDVLFHFVKRIHDSRRSNSEQSSTRNTKNLKRQKKSTRKSKSTRHHEDDSTSEEESSQHSDDDSVIEENSEEEKEGSQEEEEEGGHVSEHEEFEGESDDELHMDDE